MSREDSGSRQGRNDTGESARGHREDVSNRGIELCESVARAVKELRTQSVGGQTNQAVCPSLGQRETDGVQDPEARTAASQQVRTEPTEPGPSRGAQAHRGDLVLPGTPQSRGEEGKHPGITPNPPPALQSRAGASHWLNLHKCQRQGDLGNMIPWDAEQGVAQSQGEQAEGQHICI